MKFKKGDLVLSTSWAADEGVLVISKLPGETNHYLVGLEYYELTDGKGNFKAFHTEEMLRKLTKLEKALR